MSDVVDTPTVTHTVEFPYTRSLGPAMGAFLTGLRDRRIVGARVAGGVLVPPLEYDPATGEPLDGELTEVGPGGVVRSWCWVTEPTEKHPLERPFAFALIQPDGADTALLHAVDAGSIERMATGMRVHPRWRAERHGHITDLECFEPEA